jgi:IclR family pca regulon transcriptional regulator
MTLPADPPASDPDFVASLARGLLVIEAFRATDGAPTLADIARLVDLDRASVRRMLKTLVVLGYAATDGKRFTLTPKVLSLAAAFLGSNALPSRLQPVLEEINATLDESCSAAVLDGPEIVYIARAAGRRIMSVGLSVGSRLPAWCTSMGRVLLAGLDDKAAAALIAKARPAPLTPHTLTAAPALLERVQAARREGFALVDQELEVGLRSIAVPVRSGAGRTLAAINVSVPATRMSPAEMRERVLPLLTEAAGRLAPTLG